MVPARTVLSHSKSLILSSSSSQFPGLSILISHFSTSTSSSLLTTHSLTRRQAEEESKNVRVSVWWDFENCSLPAGVNVFRVAHAITGAVRASGIKGPVQITAFGDMLQLSRANQEALSATGINLTHVPQGGKNSADRSLLVDLMCWVSQNPPPAHLFLISGDRDFASVLHRLRMSNYNILLATREAAPSVLCSAASIMWRWSSLVRGENLTGRYFNHPPDGPFGSWYGHYKVPLENPFSAIGQPTCSQGEDLSEAGIEPRLSPIPKPVMKQIRQILSLYPEGMSIGDLRLELSKSNVVTDKNWYGYRKFSRFLLSMPHIVKLQSIGDGRYVVHGITAKPPEPFDPTPHISIHPPNNEDQHLTKTSKLNDKESTRSETVDGSLSAVTPSAPNVEEPTREVHKPFTMTKKPAKVDIEESPKEMLQPSPLAQTVVEVVNARLTESDRPHAADQDQATEVGILKKVWRRWFGSNGNVSDLNNLDISEKSDDSGDNSDKRSQKSLGNSCSFGNTLENNKVAEEPVIALNQDNDLVHPGSCSSIVQSTLESKRSTNNEPEGEKSTTGPGLFTRITNWCTFWRHNPTTDGISREVDEKIISSPGNKEADEVFSGDSFWRAMESFMETKKGSLIVMQSKTRGQMAQALQKEGPVGLKSLSESEILKLVDMLISEKKWVEEQPSEASPFKLVRFVGNNTSMDEPPASNGLRSIFLSRQSRSDLQRSQEVGDKRMQNVSHAGVSSPIKSKRPSEKTRTEILADCQKLVTEILKQSPDGYNLGLFRKDFLEKYGYNLDVQKLGYQKLASLLQIMPGVRLESCLIFPSSKDPKSYGLESIVPDAEESNASNASSNSDSELSDVSKKDEDSDSPWEELGPVHVTVSDKTRLQSASRMREAQNGHTYPDYEPSLSDDGSSDSDGEFTVPIRPERELKPKMEDEDSSLLRILDSWYSSREGENRKEKPQNAEDTDDFSMDDSCSLDSSTQGTRVEISLGSYGSKKRLKKGYSFVADPVENDKDKLIDGILGGLKKSSASRMRNRCSKIPGNKENTSPVSPC